MQIKPRLKTYITAAIFLFLLLFVGAVLSALLLPDNTVFLVAVIFPLIIVAAEIYLYFYFKSLAYFIKPDIIITHSGIIFKREKYLYLSRKTSQVKIKIPLVGVITVINLVGKRVILLCELP